MSPRRALAAPLAAATAGLAAAALLAARDPETQGPFPLCISAAVLGVQCPFCGGLRGVHDLLHGDLAAMIAHNALLPIYLVVTSVAFAWWVGSRFGYRPRVHPRVVAATLITVAAVTVGYGILRNLLPVLAASAV